MKRLVSILLAIFQFINSEADNFKGKAFIDTVPETGFYKIILPPEIISAVKADYADIRIFNTLQQEIPYVLKENDSLYTPVPSPVLKQIDSMQIKKSFVTLSFDKPYEISRLELKISGPDLFLRNFALGSYFKKNNKKELDTYNWFQISSNKPAQWEFAKIKNQELIIIIENSDNPPLKIDSVKAFQQTKNLIVRLKSGETYHLLYGNIRLNFPDYDLKYFTDSVSTNLKSINITKILSLENDEKQSSPLFLSKTFLWIVIGLIITLLSWSSIRLVNEAKKKNK